MKLADQTKSRTGTLWKQHRLLLVSSGLIVLLTLILSTLPLFIKYVIRNTLTELGVQNISIEDVDFNLFSSELVIKKASYEMPGHIPFACKRALVNIDLFPVFARQIYVDQLLLDGCRLDIANTEGDRILINGFPLPVPEQTDDQKSETAVDTSKPWYFGLHSLYVSDLMITYKDQLIAPELLIQQFSINDLVQWQPEKPTSITFLARLNNTQISLNGTTLPFSADHKFTGALALAKLDVTPFSRLTSTSNISLHEGSVETKLDISSVFSNNQYQVEIDGFITSENINSSSADNHAAYDKLLWNGKLKLAVDSKDYSATISVENDIVINGIKASLAAQHLGINSDSLAFKGQVALETGHQQNNPLQITGNLDVNNLVVSQTDKNILLAKLGTIEANTLDITENKLYFPAINVRDTKLIGEAQDPDNKSKDTSDYILRFAKLDLNAINIIDRRDISLSSIVLSDFNSQVTIDKQGNIVYLDKMLQKNSNRPEANAAPETPATTESSEKTDTLKKPDSAITFKVGSIELTGNNYFRFRDSSRAIPFQTTVHDIKVKADSIDSGDANNKTKISFSCNIDDSGSASLSGESQLFSRQLNTNLKGKVRHLELPPFSTYSVTINGRKIQQGRLDADMDLAINNREIDNELFLSISNLSLFKDDDKTAQQYDSGFPMPLETAVKLIKNKQGKIEIKVPVKGNIDNPDFKIMPAVVASLRQTIQSGALAYMKYTLQPWGTFIFVGELALGQMSKIQFEPVTFSAGDKQLSVEQKEYLDKMAKLLNEKSAISIAVCGISTAQDKKTLQTESTTVPQEKFLNLAEQRAAVVKDYLVKEKNIDIDRLRGCSPAFKNNEDEAPKVELLF